MLELSNTTETLLVDENGVVKPYTNGQSRELFKTLRQWRLGEAMAINLPAYCVLEDKTLNNIVSILPTTIQMLWLVPGLRDVKIELYGNEIINIVKSFLSKHNVDKVLYGKYAITVTQKNTPLLGYLGLLDYFTIK